MCARSRLTGCTLRQSKGPSVARTALTSAILSVLLATAAWPAFAQDEIIVTADRRGDSVAQDLPIAMNAFGAEELARRHVEDLQSLSYAMPNVQLEDIGTARGIANFSIRGVGINSSIASVDPAVGVFVDGVYLGLNAGTLTDVFDLEAVEVLRGPQGVLFGRNVTGGAVLVRTRAPSDVFEARGRLSVETGPNSSADAAISGPLIDGLLTGRVAAYYADDQGWLENGFDNSQFGENDTRVYRGALRLTPTPELEFILRGESGEIDGDGPAGQNHALFSRDGFDFAINNRGYARTDWDQLSLEANWRVGFGDGVITSISAWRETEVPWAADIDSTTAFVFHTRVLNLHEQWSQELRYAGAFGPVDVTAGAYYLEQDLLYIDERNFAPDFRRTGGGQGHFESWALFANADWHVREDITLSLGARYTEEDKLSRISRVRRAIDDLDGPGVDVPGEGAAGGSIDTRTLVFSDAPFDQSWNDLSPRVGVQWRPSPNTNLYASWSRAFRSGGANFRTASLGLAPIAYDPEQQTSIEIGWKQDFSRLRINLALFRNEIEEMQRETNQPDAISGVQQIVLNAGDAVIWGGELEARFTVNEAVTIGAFAGYTHGEYDRITEDLNGDLVINGADYALEIPRLAPWSYGADVSYEAPLGDGVFSARASYNHRDASFYSDSNLGRLAEMDRIDGHLAYGPADGAWRASVYVENLLDEASWGGDTILPATAAFGYSGGERPTFSPLNKGRVFGAEIRVRY